MDFSQDFNGIDDHILDTLGREFTLKILSRLLSKLRDKEIINELDNSGFGLIHYLTFLNYHEAIKLLGEFGANLNLISRDGSYPLIIAAARGHETSVQTLIQGGASLHPKKRH